MSNKEYAVRRHAIGWYKWNLLSPPKGQWVLTSLILCLSLLTAHTQLYYIVDTTHYFTAFDEDSVCHRKIMDLTTCELASVEVPSSTLQGTFQGGAYPQDFTFISFQNRTRFISGSDEDGISTTLGQGFGLWMSFYDYLSSDEEQYPQGLAADHNDIGYMVGLGVTRVDFQNNTMDYLGDLPPSFQAAGQMTYREGSFFYPSINDEMIQLKIGGDDFFLRAIGDLPDTLIYAGFFSVPESCDSTTTYLLHRSAEEGTTVYQVQFFPELLLSEVCQFPYKSISAGYEEEQLLPVCDLDLDLDLLSDTEIDRAVSSCGGQLNLLDQDIGFYPEIDLDSVVVELLNPIDDFNESISMEDNSSDVHFVFNSPSHITLQSTGFTRSDQYLDVLSSLSYNNDLIPPTFGQRIIRVTAYHPYLDLVTAYIILDLIPGNLTVEESIDEIECYGDATGSISLVPDNGQSPYTIQWDDGVEGGLRDSLPAGTYTASIVDAESCFIEVDYSINQPDSIVSFITAVEDTICGSNGILMANVSGGVVPYDYNWSNGEESGSISNLNSGAYQVTVIDANNCESSAGITLYEASTLEEYEQLTLCSGETYIWQGVPLSQDTSICLSTTSINGCDSLYCLDLSFLPTYYEEETYSLCQGESINLQGIVFTQDTMVSWQWTTAAGCDSTYQATIQFNASTTDLTADICTGDSYSFFGEELSISGIYSATLTNVQGCDSIITLDLSVHPLPDPVIQTDGSLCDGGALTLSTTGYATYAWSTGIQAPSTMITEAGTYILTVTDDQGCIGTSDIAISGEELLIDWSVFQPACPGDAGSLVIDAVSSGQGPYVLQLDDQQLTVPGMIDQLAPGSYAATVEDQAGCIVTLDIQIEEPEEQHIFLDETYTLSLGDSIRLTPLLGFTPAAILWSPANGLSCTDCPEPFAQPLESTRYTLEVQSPAGCTWSVATLVQVERKGAYVPNAFSPNDDGRNDTFTFFTGPSVARVHTFQVYDRWGSRIFSGTDGNWAWDGRVRGQLAPAGVYVFLLEWEDLAGNRFQEKGEVVLIR